MPFLVSFWNDYLFTPLLNFLLILYSGPAKGNLGYAVILLTLSLRVALLPLNIISFRGQKAYAVLEKKVEEIKAIYKGDSVLMRERLRAVLKKQRFSPWAKMVAIAIQVLVFILLYQVFIGGITATRLDLLYSWVYRPDVINTDFFGFNLGSHSVLWPGLVGLVLFAEIYLEQRRRGKVTRNEALYGVLFPLMSFLFLWALPMVKTLFILTTLAFSYILSLFARVREPISKA